MKNRSVLLCCSMLSLAAGAHAQTSATSGVATSAAAPAVAPVADEPANPQADANAVEGDRGAADIVVTANRRTERLQEVPIAVTVVEGAQLTRQNVNTIEDLSRTAPALSSGPPGFGAVGIRGIGGLSFSKSSEGSVGVVVDGVALANTSVAAPQLLDIARVEVLEGPQGTLFGRNASGGIINIVTNAPDFTKVEVIAHADIGTRNNYIARGTINLPVSDNAALRVSGAYNQDPQVQRNLFDGSWLRNQSQSARARFLWQPTDRVTINLSGDYNDTDIDGGARWVSYATTPNSLLTSRLAACGVSVGAENQEGCNNDRYRKSLSVYGFSGQVDMKFGDTTLTSISAYRAVALNQPSTDFDSTAATRLTQPQTSWTGNFSQELRLTSPQTGVIQYVAGLYYFDGKLTSDVTQVGAILADLPLINACPLPVAALCARPLGQTQSTSILTTSYAAFGQATINATSALRFILGARVGREDVAARGGFTPVAGVLAPIFTPPQFNIRVKDTYLSYRAGVQYDLSRDVMAYATYVRGYKGPAVNDQASTLAAASVVQPEIPKSGEIGLKSTFAGGRAALNIAGFYTEVSNFQAQFYDPLTAAFVVGNAPSLMTKGMTINLFGRPFPGFSANAGLSYIDATYGDGYLVANPAGAIVDAGGKQLAGAQKWRVTFSGEYTKRLMGGTDGFIQADVVYGSRGYSDAPNSPILSIAGSTIAGGRVGLRFDEGRFGASVFARNIFDTFRSASRFVTPTAAQQLDRAAFSQFIGPQANRVVGLSLDARF